MVKNSFRLTLVYMISGKHHNPHPIFRQRTLGASAFYTAARTQGIWGLFADVFDA